MESGMMRIPRLMSWERMCSRIGFRCLTDILGSNSKKHMMVLVGSLWCPANTDSRLYLHARREENIQNKRIHTDTQNVGERERGKRGRRWIHR